MLDNNQKEFAKGRDIKVRAYNFSLNILKFLECFPKNYRGDILGKQILRSGTSIGANIIEAQASSSKKEFKNFMNIALKSANETKYWLCLLRDGNLGLDKTAIQNFLQEAVELSKILATIQITLKKR